MDVKNTAGKLKKELGVFGIFSYIFGGTVGSGIFVSPIFIFQTVKSGGVALSVWIVAGIIAILGGVSYCELGGLVKNSGGEYTYILKGFSFRGRKPFHIIGPLLAFSAVWTYAMLLRPASFSVVMLTFAEYACKPFFGDHVEVPSYLTKLVAMLFMICLGILNCYSQKETVRVMNLLTVTKFGALLMIMIIGAIWIFSGKAYMLGPSLANGFTSDIGSIFISLYSAFWAYEGWYEHVQNTYTRIHVHAYTHTRACIHMHTHVPVHTHTQTQTLFLSLSHTYRHTHIFKHTYTHTLVYVLSFVYICRTGAAYMVEEVKDVTWYVWFHRLLMCTCPHRYS
jgi:amino acid transporter